MHVHLASVCLLIYLRKYHTGFNEHDSYLSVSPDSYALSQQPQPNEPRQTLPESGWLLVSGGTDVKCPF